MPTRELVCSISESGFAGCFDRLSASVADLELHLRRSNRRASCSKPQQYVCFSQFTVSELDGITPDLFDTIRAWWQTSHPKNKLCIIRAKGDHSLTVSCPGLHTQESSGVWWGLELFALLIVSYFLYAHFYLTYHQWVWEQVDRLSTQQFGM